MLLVSVVIFGGVASIQNHGTTYHPFLEKQYSTQPQYRKATTMLMDMAPYALTVHGGLNRIKSSVIMTAGAAWNPLSRLSAWFYFACHDREVHTCQEERGGGGREGRPVSCR